MELRNDRPIILGMYLSDGTTLSNGNGNDQLVMTDPRLNRYLPIFNMFTINQQDQLTLTNGKNFNQDVRTYDPSAPRSALDTLTRKTKTIEIDKNDLLVGPVRVFLNLTLHPITVSLPGEMRKVYHPIENKQLSSLRGKAFLLTIHTLNTPDSVFQETGLDNYIDALRAQFKRRASGSHDEIIEILDYVATHLEAGKLASGRDATSTIKVVTLQEVHYEDLNAIEDKSVHLTYPDVVVSLSNILAVSDHPSTDRLLNSGIDFKALLDGSVICYIVDNHDLLMPRYINIAGRVKTVPKVKSPRIPEGLYITTYQNGVPHSEVVATLKDLDDSQFVYDSHEKATRGADVMRQYNDSIAQAKAELEEVKVENEKTLQTIKLQSAVESEAVKSEGLRIRTEYEAKLREQNLAYEKELLEAKARLEKAKHESDYASMRTRSTYDQIKYELDYRSQATKQNYEVQKYERDSTVETIKTVGSVAGGVAALFLLYSKLSK